MPQPAHTFFPRRTVGGGGGREEGGRKTLKREDRGRKGGSKGGGERRETLRFQKSVKTCQRFPPSLLLGLSSSFSATSTKGRTKEKERVALPSLSFLPPLSGLFEQKFFFSLHLPPSLSPHSPRKMLKKDRTGVGFSKFPGEEGRRGGRNPWDTFISFPCSEKKIVPAWLLRQMSPQRLSKGGGLRCIHLSPPPPNPIHPAKLS